MLTASPLWPRSTEEGPPTLEMAPRPHPAASQPLDTSVNVVILVTMSVDATSSMSLAEAKAHLSEVVGRVGTHHERVLVTVHGSPSAVLIAPADLEALEETIAVLSDREALARLTTSEAELAAGLGEGEADLAAAMRTRRASAAS